MMKCLLVLGIGFSLIHGATPEIDVSQELLIRLLA
jgi:hypothetical protein